MEVSYKLLETYKQDFLSGRVQTITDSHFRRAVDEIKNSGDMDLLGKAWLTRMALQTAILAPADGGDYPKIEAVQPVPGNRAFYLFLKGDQTDVSLLTESYRSCWTAFQKGDAAKAAAAISAIQDPLSRLIASGLAVRKGLATEAILLNAVDNASRNGWKQALLVWLERLHAFHEAAGETNKAAAVSARMDLIR